MPCVRKAVQQHVLAFGDVLVGLRRGPAQFKDVCSHQRIGQLSGELSQHVRIGPAQVAPVHVRSSHEVFAQTLHDGIELLRTQAEPPRQSCLFEGIEFIAADVTVGQFNWFSTAPSLVLPAPNVTT